ncbi:hypothetical protein MRB53_009149 [Persea americana]|uniref:Uncharacterized protein n=1 Tax=Persea americana TaxID=3435 RepID=A0ACC2LNA8_PERAE|nr:hypothetical protein MRB53_009149 [Persea americana]
MIPLVSSILGFPDENGKACEMSPPSVAAERGKTGSGAAAAPLVEEADMAVERPRTSFRRSFFKQRKRIINKLDYARESRMPFKSYVDRILTVQLLITSCRLKMAKL